MMKIDREIESVFKVRVTYTSPSKGEISRSVKVNAESAAHAKIEAVKMVVSGRKPTNIKTVIE